MLGVADSITDCVWLGTPQRAAGVILIAYFGPGEANFWKSGSLRSGSNRSRRSNAGVSGTLLAPRYNSSEKEGLLLMAWAEDFQFPASGKRRRNADRRDNPGEKD